MAVFNATAAPPATDRALTVALVLFDTLTLGVCTLGFEMVASRILTPMFGSGIYTWASIISIVVGGLMAGYFLGGFVADRWPSFGFAALIKLIAGAYLGMVALWSDGLIEGVFTVTSDDIIALFLAGALVCLPPLLVLGMFSPLAVRLVLRHAGDAGKVSGGLFALSSLGNIAGILVTTFYLIPSFGSRAISGGFGLFLLASSLLSIVAAQRLGRRS